MDLYHFKQWWDQETRMSKSELGCRGGRWLAVFGSSGLALTVLALGACSAGEAGGDEPASVQPGASQPVDGALRVSLQSLGEGTGALEYAVTNTSSAPVRFLERDTALGGVFSNQFDVSRAGVPARYIGMSVIFAAPRPADFIELAPGETQTRTIVLTELYDLQPGDYSVLARPRYATLPPVQGAGATGDGASTAVAVDDAPLTVRVAERKVTVEKAADPCEAECENNCLFLGDPGSIGLCISACPADCAARNVGTFFVACSASEESEIAAARAHGSQMAADGAAAVDSSSLYEKWFGSRSTARTNRVKSVLNSATNDVTSYTHHCLPAGRLVDASNGAGCSGSNPSVTKPFFAATGGSTLGGDVGICPDFFSGESADQEAATLVHEATHHFGTDDVVSSPSAALNLALTNPGLAVEDAESYEDYVLEFR
jgi:peptidyl-Lys metalloendopeptidase